MKKFALILLTIVVTGIAAQAQVKQSAVVTNLSVERFKAVIAADKIGMLIDLRTPEEIADGYIKGALFLDYLAKDSEKQIAKLDKNKTYYVYCRSGKRSLDCAQYMEKQGFKRVYNLEKGFSDWAQKGMPVEKK